MTATTYEQAAPSGTALPSRPVDHERPLPDTVIARCAQSAIDGPVHPGGVQ